MIEVIIVTLIVTIAGFISFRNHEINKIDRLYYKYYIRETRSKNEK